MQDFFILYIYSTIRQTNQLTNELIMEGHIKSSTSNGIATITFFHPQSNSMPGALLRQLAEEITKAGNDSNAKVIVL